MSAICEICCGKPRVEVEFTFPQATQIEMYQRIEWAVMNSPRFRFSEHDDLTKTSMDVCYFTDCCLWLDRQHFTVVETGSGSDAVQTIVKAESHSTNICPIWCLPCRFVCCFCNAFIDHGKNIEHLRVLMEAAAEAQNYEVSEAGEEMSEEMKSIYKLKRDYFEKLVRNSWNGIYDPPKRNRQWPANGGQPAPSTETMA